MKVTREGYAIPQGVHTLGGSPGAPAEAPPSPGCCDTSDNVPDRALEPSVTFVWFEATPGTLMPVQAARSESGGGSSLTVTLDDPVTPGNLLVGLLTTRADTTDPLTSDLADRGWARVEFTHSDTGANGGGSELWYRAANDDDTDTFQVNFGAGEQRRWTVQEFDGYAELSDHVEDHEEESVDAAAVTGLVVSGSALLVAAWNFKRDSGTPTLTFGDSFSELDQGGVGGASDKPRHALGYKNVTAGTYQSSITTDVNMAGWGAILASFEFPDDGGDWVPGGDAAADGDDATYTQIEGEDILVIDLGGQFEIVRTRLRVAEETAGAKTYYISAANEADLSDETLIATITFTGTGSYTPEDVTHTWLPSGAYQYWILRGSDQTRRIHTWSLYEPTLETNHQHTLDQLSDVDTTGVTDGQVLVYDDGTNSWVPGSAVADHGALTGLTDDDHPQYVPITTGAVRFLDHGNSGSSETIDLGAANVHRLTLDDDCTLTLTGAVATRGGSPASCSVIVEVEQDGTGGWDLTWPMSVDFGSGDDQPDQTADSLSVFTLWTDDGGTSWLGFRVGGSGGGGGTPATTVEAETTFGISPAVGTDTEYARQDHTHGTPDTDAVRDAGRWELAVISGDPPDPLYADGDFLYIWVPGE